MSSGFTLHLHWPGPPILLTFIRFAMVSWRHGQDFRMSTSERCLSLSPTVNSGGFLQDLTPMHRIWPLCQTPAQVSVLHLFPNPLGDLQYPFCKVTSAEVFWQGWTSQEEVGAPGEFTGPLCKQTYIFQQSLKLWVFFFEIMIFFQDFKYLLTSSSKKNQEKGFPNPKGLCSLLIPPARIKSIFSWPYQKN